MGPGYTVTVNLSEHRATWEGWGCSLSWWANVVGSSSYQNLYADLFFTQNDVPILDRSLPGLGMNIARYNVGGGGRPGDIPGAQEAVPAELPWYKDIDGYWVDWNSTDPASNSWDFYRDSNQRNMMWAARDRGVDAFEFFSTSPMWWMKDSKSSAGGNVQSWNRRDMARYVATVAKFARDHWGVNVASVEPFNEPSAGWWTYPNGQEGANIPIPEQKEILGDLREELDARGLGWLPIAASDENSMTQALTTYGDLRASVGKLNVHGYDGLEPWRDDVARQRLRALAGGARLWMSEYGDNDGSGMALAQTITEDMTYLRPTAWIYWQPLEPFSAWGFVNGNYGDDTSSPDRGAPTWIYTKYYMMAQFTRFVRPGNVIVGNDDSNTIAAYDPSAWTLSFVTVNYGSAQTITYELGSLRSVGADVTVTATAAGGGRLFETSQATVSGRRVALQAEANTVYSLVFRDVAP